MRLALAFVILVLSLVPVTGARGPFNQANTSSGILIGQPSPQAPNVDEYLGIPYAKPPIGNLRFAEPQPYNGKGKRTNATQFSPACLYRPVNYLSGNNPVPGFVLASGGRLQFDTLLQVTNATFSEDCLTINVWTPRSASSSSTSGKAVMIWIPGGGFSMGSSAIPDYYGARLANEQNVVVVSFNYRLKIFGFPGNPDGPQNLGLLDQRLAVEWTSNNVASFGGDSKRMILFGQSAGGESIDYYTFAYADDPIVSGFLSQSGTVFTAPPTPPGSTAKSWYSATATLGCGNTNTSSDAILACMRSKKYLDIEALVSNGLALSAGSPGSFGPVVDNKTIFSDYISRAQAGKFARLPLLIGNNEYESGTFKTIIALTPGIVSAGLLPPDATFNVLDYVGFNCPVAQRAYYSEHAGVTTYRYRFFGDFPNLRLTTVPDSGVRHAAENRLLFDQLDGLTASTPQETAIAKFMRDSWAAFAKDPEAGLQQPKLGWSPYDPAKETLVRLAYQNHTGANAGDPADYDYACPFFGTLFGISGAPADLALGNQAQYERLGNLTRAVAEDLLSSFNE